MDKAMREANMSREGERHTDRQAESQINGGGTDRGEGESEVK